MRSEQQQRLFQDMYPGRNSRNDAEWYDLGSQDAEWQVDVASVEVENMRQPSFLDDMSEVKCSQLQKHGHVSINCPEKKLAGRGFFTRKGFQEKKERSVERRLEQRKGKNKGKDQGKAKGKGFAHSRFTLPLAPTVVQQLCQ